MRKYNSLKKKNTYKYIAVSTLYWLLQKNSSTTTKTPDIKSDLEKEKIDFERIRCPLCEWRPSASSRWLCSDCTHPENFFSGCGKVWNTFLTRGLCPKCNHQWRWTSCLSCCQWSLHETWYEKESR